MPNSKEMQEISMNAQTNTEGENLSIIVQGGIFCSNLSQIANNCSHWRKLFPKSQLILSVSSSDIIQKSEMGSEPKKVEVVSGVKDEGYSSHAFNILTDVCDAICFGSPALPLPPIKSDSPKLNNINLQISAAKSGLALVKNPWVLRVRNDLVFLDKTFIGYYHYLNDRKRGSSSVFEDRVLISYLYTINPYTVERMPLHFSDWFHFGRTDDVRKIWNVEFMTLADSTYYVANGHADYSNYAERYFNTKLAVEQHLMVNCFKPHFPSLTVDYHNDQRSVDLSMSILADNFVICDPVICKCIFGKYSHEFRDYTKELHCITASDWMLLTENLGLSPRVTLQNKILEFYNRDLFDREASFPRRYGVNRLHTKIGAYRHDVIVSREKTGVLLFGPLVRIPSGSYVAHIETKHMVGKGLVKVRATTHRGRVTLAESVYSLLDFTPPSLKVSFEISENDIIDFEIVVEINDIELAVVSGIEISDRSADRYSVKLPYRYHGSDLLPIATSRSSERQFQARTPDFSVPLGYYKIVVTLKGMLNYDRTTIQLKSTRRSKSLSYCDKKLELKRSAIYEIDLIVADPSDRRFYIEIDSTDFEKDHIEVISVHKRTIEHSEETILLLAEQLSTRSGTYMAKEIVSQQDGVLCYGPYASISAGSYNVKVYFSEIVGSGLINFKVCAKGGALIFASKSYTLNDLSAPMIVLPFIVHNDSVVDLEFVIDSKGFSLVKLASVMVEPRSDIKTLAPGEGVSQKNRFISKILKRLR